MCQISIINFSVIAAKAGFFFETFKYSSFVVSSKLLLRVYRCEDINNKMMNREILLRFCFLTLVFAQNPCSNYWKYVRSQNQIQGLLTFYHNQRITEHHLRVVLSLGSKLPSVSIQWNFINNFYQIF